MNTNHIQIRETTAADFDDIIRVERQAFGYDKEADFTADLLADPTAEPMLSLLAFAGDQAVGHILFTRARFDGQEHSPMMHILAPLAVQPDLQRQGIGGMLIREGIERLRAIGSHIVFVLGHKEYYPRHGFIPDADGQGYPAPFPILDENRDCWMVQPIGPEGLAIDQCKIACCEAMHKPEHWRNDEADR